MKWCIGFTLAAAVCLNITVASAQQLPRCDDPDVALEAFKLGMQVGNGHIDNTYVELIFPDKIQAVGINNSDSSKICKATYRCDMEKAREMERQIIGPHPLSNFCFRINQAWESGNPVGLQYTVRPNGEGGFLVRVN